MQRKQLRAVVVLSVALAQPSNAARQSATQPLAEASHSTIGYGRVAEALKALRLKAGVVFSMENGWLIATDEAAYTIWSFAPEGYPAYPAVVKRQAIPKGNNASLIEMTVECRASKDACDELVRTFAEKNGLPISH